MTELDQALAALNENPADPTAKMDFYTRFLHTIFFVPIKKLSGGEKDADKEVELPLIIENDGSDFLVFFDDQQRLNAWAEQHAPCAQMPGYAIAEISTAGLWWAMNVGTEHDKQFAPDEIAWLKNVIAASTGA